jgi:hypothetical protein
MSSVLQRHAMPCLYIKQPSVASRRANEGNRRSMSYQCIKSLQAMLVANDLAKRAKTSLWLLGFIY